MIHLFYYDFNDFGMRSSDYFFLKKNHKIRIGYANEIHRNK